MGVAIKCVLEHEVSGIPWLEGKSLAMAYCGDPRAEVAEEPAAGADNIIAVDFGGGKSRGSSPGASPSDSLLTPLDQFICDGQGFQWHDAALGISAVRGILAELRNGALVTIAADFAFGDDDGQELTEGVRDDLEELEKILIAAHKEHVRFQLAFDV